VAVSKYIIMKNIPKIYSFTRSVHYKLEKKLVVVEDEKTTSYVKELQFPIYESLMFDSKKEIDFIVKELSDRLEGEHPQPVSKAKDDNTITTLDLPWKILNDSIIMNPTAETTNNTAKYDITIDSIISIITDIRKEIANGELQPPQPKEDPILANNKKEEHFAGKNNKGKRLTSIPWLTGFTFWDESNGINFDNYPAEQNRRVINVIRLHAKEEIPQLPGYAYLTETVDNQSFKPKKKAAKKVKKETKKDDTDDEEEKPKQAAPKEEEKPKKKATAPKKVETKAKPVVADEPSEDEEEEEGEINFEHAEDGFDDEEDV
jgi:hypothetical protein